MKEYHHIEYWKHGTIGAPIVAFDKMDGSNIRCEWSYKLGFYKFGTRNQIINEKADVFGEAIILFMKKYAEPLTEIFKTDKDYRNIKNFIVFSEFYGPNSAFGLHDPNDVKDITMFDIWQHQRGWVEPRKFIKKFSNIGIPRVVYEGNLNKSFVKDVHDNKFGLVEGVICKGLHETKRVDKRVWMVKAKTADWFERLKNKYGQDAVLKEVNNEMDVI
jgi:hypothetical protein